MHLLTVYSHPFTDRYPAVVMEEFHKPFRQADWSIDVLDLHREEFDPRYTREDHAHFWGGPVPTPPGREGRQARVHLPGVLVGHAGDDEGMD